ncbi:hypothetical protein KIN20_021746 [Parelaphostrongylus tenuis]|uniref:Uncharacterized protein n=1 Tax=Parelaphostrongylus tenuis TaxID=148309 RepID=A0AAD5QRS0_PARTN|nr:hypothetical protein KIN20_021746 [Parelaphostrongylus tenuis]
MDNNDEAECNMLANLRNIEAIPANYISFSGTFLTTNIIMANWSRAMWQSVVNRAIRMLAAGPFATHFSSAFATGGFVDCFEVRSKLLREQFALKAVEKGKLKDPRRTSRLRTPQK